MTSLLLGLGLTLLFGLGLGQLAQRWHLPDIVLYLLLGIVLGPAALGLLRPQSFPLLSQALLLFGAAYLLFEGGRSVDGEDLRTVGAATAYLATAGVAVTAGILALSGHYLLGVPWRVALLLGAVLAPTDPAVIAPLFAAVQVRRRLAALLLAESAANDATGAALATAAAAPAGTGLAALATLLWSLLGGGVVGLAIGYGAHRLEQRAGARSHHLRPLGALVAVLLAYALAAALHASGFLSAFVAGLFAGRTHRRLRERDPVAAHFYEYYAGTTGRAVRTLVFAILGADLDLRLGLGMLGPALLLALVLVAVARPLTVQLLHLDRRRRWQWREVLFASWVRETGVVPAALAGLLLAARAPGAREIAATVFVTLLVTVLLQVPTTEPLARRLGLLQPPA